MIDWVNLSAEEIRANGRKIVEQRTVLGGEYGIYLYKGYLVQIDEVDGDIVIALKDGQVVWVHPVTGRGLSIAKAARIV